LSTDKAVQPINAMGMSKAMMEKLTFTYGLNHKSTVKTIYNVTRYGNVMGSRGSVIPLFINLLLNDQELTVTDMNMTRFMMSLQESVNLVLYALENGTQGELFVQKAPSATIECLIGALETIFNKKAKIKIIGFRHSEKLHETLLSAEEATRSTSHDHYFRVKPDLRDLNYSNSNPVESTALSPFDSSNTKILNVEELVQLLLKQDFISNYLK
jgi:UDP-glucose 4-epimerase